MSWIATVRTGTDPAVVAEEILADPDAPAALVELAAAYVRPRAYRSHRPRSRTSDPDTSRVAGDAVRRPETVAHRLLGAFAVVGMLGRTAEEAATAIYRPSAWRRVSELVADGLLAPALDRHGEPMTRGTRAGREARVLVLTHAGRAELSRLERAAAWGGSKRRAVDQLDANRTHRA